MTSVRPRFHTSSNQRCKIALLFSDILTSVRKLLKLSALTTLGRDFLEEELYNPTMPRSMRSLIILKQSASRKGQIERIDWMSQLPLMRDNTNPSWGSILVFVRLVGEIRSFGIDCGDNLVVLKMCLTNCSSASANNFCASALLGSSPSTFCIIVNAASGSSFIFRSAAQIISVVLSGRSSIGASCGSGSSGNSPATRATPLP